MPSNMEYAAEPAPRRKSSLHVRIAHDLGVAIVTGKHGPGEVLTTEVQSSENLSVSRSAYREAIRILAAKGLVESRQKAGTIVSPITRWALLDPDVMAWMFEGGPSESVLQGLFEMRLIVEPAIASLAAQRRTLAHIGQMRSALQEMEHDTLSDKRQAADRRFHEVILHATANPPLVNLGYSLGAFVRWFTEYKERHGKLSRDAMLDHWRVFDAIAAGAPDEAKAAMEDLIRAALADVHE
ncbi:FadR/GntR family transcriptional regulator [soil metagenome]